MSYKKKFGEEITVGLILTCLAAVAGFGGCFILVMKAL
jgi:hypothetical protein